MTAIKQPATKITKTKNTAKNLIDKSVWLALGVVLMGCLGFIAVRLATAASPASPATPTAKPSTTPLPKPQATPPPPSSDLAASQILVKYKDGVDPQSLKPLFETIGATQIEEVDNLHIIILKVPAANRDRIIGQLKLDARLEYASPDSVIHNE